MLYNPFGKDIDELETLDLAKLRAVSEGWHVEYKRELPDRAKLAKSLSAFANHYGGWLFIGVAEAPNGSQCAGDFLGIDENATSDAIQRLQDAAKSHVNPAPYFRHTILRGPCAVSGLPEGRAMLVILVPSGATPPYIHASGRIYRRIADSSDPKHETDRATLDLLWERGSKNYDRLREKLNGLVAPNSLNLALFTDPLGAFGHRSKLTFPEFAGVVKTVGKSLFGITFDQVWTTSNGFIARHAFTNDAMGDLLSLRYYADCRAEIVVPLTRCPAGPQVLNFFKGYTHVDELLKRQPSFDREDRLVADFNHLFFVLTALLDKYRNLLAEEGMTVLIHAKARITGGRGMVAFLDTPAFDKFASEYGLPMLQDESCFVPSGFSPPTFVQLPARSPDRAADGNAAIGDAMPILAALCRACGVPFEVLRDSAPDLFHAGLRYQQVQKYRSGESE